MMPPLTSQPRRFLAIGLAASVLTAGLQGQATPKPAIPSSPTSPGPTIDSRTTDTQPTSTIKVSVRRVVVDVTVTDAKGKPVQGLTEQDFHVFEDGAPQTVRSFEIHTAEPQAPLQLPKLPLNTFANLSSAPAGGPTTVILYDLLNTPLDSQPFAHSQLLDFLKQRKASGQVAIFVLSDKLHMLQGFTDDDNKLIAALNLQKDHYRSGLLQTQAETTQGSDQLARTDGNQNGADARQDTSFQTVSAMLKHMETMESSYMLDRRVDYTAEALEEIARFLIGLPGRKNLLWLSGSFPDGIIPNSAVDGTNPIAGQDEFGATRNYSSAIQLATNELNLSHVAVYPVDVRGLQVNGMFSAASSQTFEPGQGKDLQAVQNFSQQTASEHATMDVIGNETGGRAFYNTNGLKEAAAEAIAEGSLYYTLSYTPTNRGYDGKLRRVRVDLKQSGYHLAYRRSYFGNGLDDAARNQQDAPSDALAVTLEHGAPVAHELFFEAHVVSEGAPVPATHEQMDELIRYEAMATKSKRKADQELKTPILLQRYVIQYGLIPRQLDLRLGADQARRDNLEFAAVSYNEDGLTLNGTRTRIQDVIRPDRWSMMQESGYHVPMVILVPIQARSLRLAVRDASNGHMGSLELSLPLPPEPATTAPPEAPPPAPASVPPAS
jgi:VWFA-related protein